MDSIEMETAHEKHTPFAVPATIYIYLCKKEYKNILTGFYSHHHSD